MALLALATTASLAWSASRAAASTLVGFNFANLGTVYVDLWDDLTPLSVTNFLGYVNASAYSNTVIHRSALQASSVGIGIIQGGGFRYNDATQSFSGLATGNMVNNEYARANTRGTISMARIQGINTATSQWFFNTTDNSDALGPQNTVYGPFTTFGWVVGPGMSVIDAIGGIGTPTYTARNFSGTAFYNNGNFGSLPVTSAYTQDDYDANVKPTSSEMAVLTSVSVFGTHAAYQNPYLNGDVDNNGVVQPHDALLVINDILDHNNQIHDVAGPFAGTSYLDVTGNGRIEAFDALRVINTLLEMDQQNAQTQAAGVQPLAMTALALPVPEPSTLALVVAGTLVLAGCARARRLRRRC